MTCVYSEISDISTHHTGKKIFGVTISFLSAWTSWAIGIFICTVLYKDPRRSATDENLKTSLSGIAKTGKMKVREITVFLILMFDWYSWPGCMCVYVYVRYMRVIIYSHDIIYSVKAGSEAVSLFYMLQSPWRGGHNYYGYGSIRDLCIQHKGSHRKHKHCAKCSIMHRRSWHQRQWKAAGFRGQDLEHGEKSHNKQ